MAQRERIGTNLPIGTMGNNMRLAMALKDQQIKVSK